MITSYVITFSYLSWLRYDSFSAYALDLGLFEQSFWTTLHGKGIFYNTIEGASHFNVHLSPIMFLILPVYALYQKTITLLVLQTLAIALGSLPLFLMAKDKLGSEQACVVTAIYFLYPALWGVNLFDWHPVAFAIPFLMGSFYFFQKRRYVLYALFVALALACKETVALPILLLGVYGLWRYRSQIASLHKSKFREARPAVICLATIGVAIGWLALHFMILPPPSGYSAISANFGYLGSSLGEVASTIIADPSIILAHLFSHDSLCFLVTIFAPLAYLPFLSPGILGISGLSFLMVLLSVKHIQLPIYQYPSTIIPFVFAAMVYGLSRFDNRARKILLLVTLGASIISVGFVQTSDYSRLNTDVRPPSSHDKVMERVLEEIPAQASVLTTSTYFTHLARRENAYLLSLHPAASNVYPENIEYILLDPKARVRVPSSFKPLQRVMDDMGVYAFADGAQLLKRGFRGEPLRIEPPLQGSLKVEYYQGDNFDQKLFESATTSVNFNWGHESPLRFIPKDHFTISLRGQIYIPNSGEYTFRLDSDDGSVLYIDGQKVVGELHQKLFSGSGKVRLKEGWHTLEIKYWEWEGSAMMNLTWKKPRDAGWGEIPSSYFARPGYE